MRRLHFSHCQQSHILETYLVLCLSLSQRGKSLRKEGNRDRSQGAVLGWICSSRLGVEDEIGEKGGRLEGYSRIFSQMDVGTVGF